MRRIALVLLLTALAWYATTFAHTPSGFTGRYYAGGSWTGSAILTTIDERVSPDVVRRTWRQVDEPFSVRWEAYLLLDRSTACRFSVLSTGATRFAVDDREIVDSDVPWRRQVTADVHLVRGVHRLRLEYASARSSPDIKLFWATSGMEQLTALAGPAISPRPPSSSQRATVFLVDRTRLAIVTVWTIAYLWLLIRYAIVPLIGRLVRHHLPDGLPPAVVALLAGVACLYGMGITWGIPGPGWAPDELLPVDLGAAIDTAFSHGWWSKYPPAQFYLSAVVGAPLLIWRWLDPLAYGMSFASSILLILFRLVTIAMAVGTALMTYVCGAHVYRSAEACPERYEGTQWPAFVAAALAALTMPIVYYGKVANVDVPFVFWFTVSLAAFARILIHRSAVDYLVFAVTAALAVCTKDQAYGLYALPAIALVFLKPVRWRLLLANAAVAAIVWAVSENLLFNWTGFLTHARFITSPGAAPFRMFAPTAAGQWQLANAVMMLLRLSFGWPAFLLCAAGLALSIWRPRAEHRRLWWLLLPAVSYCLTFLAVVGYAYDRFLLPIFPVLALAGGFCAWRLDQVQRFRRLSRGAIIAILAYSCVYVMAVNVTLLRDSRYEVERWMHAHIEPGATIGLIGPAEHLPRIDAWYTESVDPTVDVIQSLGFEYLVVNADWAERFGPERAQGQGYRALREGRLKYRPVFESHNPVSVAGMSFDSRFDDVRASGFTTLTKLNPPTLVFRREPASPGTPAPTARTP